MRRPASYPLFTGNRTHLSPAFSHGNILCFLQRTYHTISRRHPSKKQRINIYHTVQLLCLLFILTYNLCYWQLDLKEYLHY